MHPKLLLPGIQQVGNHSAIVGISGENRTGNRSDNRQGSVRKSAAVVAAGLVDNWSIHSLIAGNEQSNCLLGAGVVVNDIAVIDHNVPILQECVQIWGIALCKVGDVE